MNKIRLRVSVVALFVDGDEVLLLHQATPPEPDCWDLPGGGLELGETLLAGLAREVREEVGIEEFRVDGLLTVLENFFPWKDDSILHTLNIVYKCSVTPKPTQMVSQDPEIGPNGIQWLRITELKPSECSQRSWKALEAAGLV